MTNLLTRHLLTGAELSAPEMLHLFKLAQQFKQARAKGLTTPLLANQHLALLFSKPSLRTRFSFTVAMRELGGDVVESVSDHRKAEEPEDQIRVLAGYCHAVMVRTHADAYLTRMAQVSSIPVINGLSNNYHPCQALADMLTLQECFHELKNLHLAYIGDGNNVLHSLLLTAPRLGIKLHYCCPQDRAPLPHVVAKAVASAANGGSVVACDSPLAAVSDAHAVYTDVWTSMGFEGQVALDQFAGFQVNEALMKYARTDAVFMHCMPMQRGQEVSVTLPDKPCSVIYQQSENRLHVQKALLAALLSKQPIHSILTEEQYS